MKYQDYAAKALFEAIPRRDGHDWGSLPEEAKDEYRLAAAKVVEAADAPFYVRMEIKVPHQSPISQNILWSLAFGRTDEEIEEAGKQFVQRMKEVRGNDFEKEG